jgi:hypothetical protein
MNIYLPFTYVLTFKPTGQRYYGVRYAKNAHPSQLWTTYFTSSKVIKSLLTEHGPEAFTVSVRRTFTTKESAVLWESRVLNRLNASHSNQWFNQINGDANFASILEWSDEAKAKYSERRKGIQFSEEHKANLAKAKQGTKQSEEHKSKRSAALKGRTRPPRSQEWKDKIKESLKLKREQYDQ